ncbi:hypothetical protein MKX01_003047 [Papaver californicum]|nr:hypothetical protein MKX01_003047 [Papaver californicum]
MGRDKVDAGRITSFLLFIMMLCRFPWKVQCQKLAGLNQTSDPELYPLLAVFKRTSNPQLLKLVTKLIYKRLSNLTTIFHGEDSHNLAFCVKDQKEDWNAAFNFKADLDFLSSCIERTKGDITQRLCTAAEIKFYLHRYLLSKTKSNTYLKPDENSNLTTWNPGCEPGWDCRVDFDDLVDLVNLKDMPTRATNCHSCCEGFFCPQGLTCMIPCPLSSYCPLAELNKTTSMCDPYHYQLPHKQLNHTCGGADSWVDITTSTEMFCSAGSYCPTTTTKIPCSDGHYCRTGSRSEKKCFKLTSCNLNTATQGLRLYGAILIVALSALLIYFYYCGAHVLTIREKRKARSMEAATRKAARDVTKKHALGREKSSPHTFGQTEASARQPEDIIIFGPARTETDEGVDISRTSQQKSSNEEIENKKIPTNSMGNTHDLKGSFNSNQDFSTESSKTHAPMAKHMHTTIQIFKYVYGKIEKEKAQQHGDKHLTFSEVIEMATKMQVIMTGPVIEISFRELTLTLKGKNKYLMRCVTGKIRPGRVSAVMGPSGAGKTTFLNALAGKATGCKKAGLILINGKNESIHSYSLFKMFDDLILLAKGGLTVYHGPVKNVEEYFAGLGVIVPDRGVVPSTSIDMKQLPLRWMLHNGYPIPRDMQLDAAETECNVDVDGTEVRSYAGDLWEDVKSNAEIQQDNFHHNFLMLKDLSNRRTPGVLKLYKYYLGRVSKQRLRESKIQAVDFLIIAALRSFSHDKLIYWRESSSGMSSLAYFLSKDTVDHFNTLVKPVVYLSMFYFFNDPRSSFMDYYIVLVFLVYCVTGVAYVFSIFLEPGSVLLPVVLTLVSTQQSTGLMKFIANLCYPKWALQAFMISNAERYSGVWMITRCGSLMKSGYDIRNWNRCIIVLFLYGAGSRILAFFNGNFPKEINHN